MKLKIIVLFVFIFSVNGCASSLYIRDIYSKPLQGANVQPVYWSIRGNPSTKTDRNGFVKIPWFITGIEGIEVSKEGYHTLYLNNMDLEQKPYIGVLVPVAIELKPFIKNNTELNTIDPFIQNNTDWNIIDIPISNMGEKR